MTDSSNSLRPDEPALADWTGPSACRRSPRRARAFPPAFDRALAAHRAEIDAIAADPAPPTFDNTIGRWSGAGGTSTASPTCSSSSPAPTPTRRSRRSSARSRRCSPATATRSTSTARSMPASTRSTRRATALGLTAEQARVLDRYLTRFVRAGAALDKPAQARLAAINERLASLGTQFSQNVLADEKAYALVLEEGDLAGLPEFVRASARAAAQERGLAGKHVITLARSSVRELPAVLRPPRPARKGVPGLDQARRERRRDRQQGHHRRDGRAARRAGKAARLSRPSPTTGSTTRWPRRRRRRASCSRRSGAGARAKALAERDALQEMIAQEGGNFALAPWDWRYYAEKLRKAEFDLDEAEIKPYFQLERMIEAAFETARRLFGLTSRPRRAGLSSRRAGLGGEGRAAAPRRPVLRRLFRPRLQAQRRLDDLAARPGEARRRVRPIVVNVCNFSKPAAGEPALLSFDDARTLFHEFGHALHGLLSDVTYPLLAGTAVSSDFVELPSQLYEHWLEVPEILQKFARHTAPASRCRRRCSTGCSRRAPSTRVLPRSNTSPARWSISTCMRCREPATLDVERVRARGVCAHRHAGGDRHAPPPAAFPACVLRRRLCGGLLLLHVVGGARRRRVRGLRGDRRRLRSRDRQAAARLHLQRRQLARPGRGLQSLPRPPADGRRAAEEARA